MLNPSIRKRTLDKIIAYCISQDIDVEEYINDILEDAINLELYGDINEKIKTTRQAVAVSEVSAVSGIQSETIKEEQVASAPATEDNKPVKKETKVAENKVQETETPKRNKRVRTIASK